MTAVHPRIEGRSGATAISDFPTDIYTEPSEIDPDTMRNLGPLAPLAGVWEGERGLDVNPKAEGPEKDAYYERYELQPIDPQANGPQLLYGLRYHQHVLRPDKPETFHDPVARHPPRADRDRNREGGGRRQDVRGALRVRLAHERDLLKPVPRLCVLEYRIKVRPSPFVQREHEWGGGMGRRRSASALDQRRAPRDAP